MKLWHWFVGAFLIVVLAIGVYLAYAAYKSFTCDQRWPDSQGKWGYFSGCTIVVHGRRIPEDRFRAQDIDSGNAVH